MVDWQAVAVFLAGATWLATTLFGQPLTLVKDWVLKNWRDRSYQCQAICWQHLPKVIAPRSVSRSNTNTIGWETRNANEHSLERGHATRAFLGVIDALFTTKPVHTQRPTYLNRNVKYLRTDGDTLLVFLLSCSEVYFSSSGTDDSTPALTFRAGAVYGRFHSYQTDGETYIIGRLLSDTSTGSTWKINPQIYGLPKDVLRLIADGYPPFFRDRITLKSGGKVAHPIREPRGRCRGGWIIAIGLCNHEPVLSYNGRFVSDYKEACTRVLQTLEQVIQPAFSALGDLSAFCNIAIRAIRRMNSNESGSGLRGFLSGTDYEEHCNRNLGIDKLTTEQCRLAMRLFDTKSEEPLAGDDRTDFEHILVPVLRAAIEGVHSWWQYKNNKSGQLPRWLLEDGVRHAPIWIED